MKKFIAGIVVGLVAAVGGTATAAELGDWRQVENSGVICAIGRNGTAVNTSGVCTVVGGKWHLWSVSIDKALGIKVENANKQKMFGRGVLGDS